MSQVSTVSGER